MENVNNQPDAEAAKPQNQEPLKGANKQSHDLATFSRCRSPVSSGQTGYPEHRPNRHGSAAAPAVVAKTAPEGRRAGVAGGKKSAVKENCEMRCVRSRGSLHGQSLSLRRLDRALRLLNDPFAAALGP